MLVHLVDGTYELFRHFFAVPPEKNADGLEVAAIQGVLASMLYLLGEGATHLAVATDHVIESFRNDLWPGYKTSAGVEEVLLAQFHPLEQALSAMGVVVFPMVEFEADDALAAAASASSASNSTIGQTTTPSARSESSSSGNCDSRAGGMPAPVL